ncbi:MAG: beta-ketoacyl-ACP synthase II [Clostridiales bacterium]|nr:beta-ketoacyl-ACP synthase II [Clostridiales bacterium]MCF8022595.1 beta-ketoacyl-ACP synthase II [Clostridiales bacterium]
MLNRVVITGLGVVSPAGTGLENFWSNLLSGVSGVGPITRFDAADFNTRIAAEVGDFNAADFLDRKAAKRMDRFTQFALASTQMAFDDAKFELDKINTDRTAVIMGSGIGGLETLEHQKERLLERGPSRVSPFFIPMMISNMASAQIAINYGLHGANYTTTSACASANNAIGDSFKLLQRGQADIAITGGSEAPITPLAVGGFCAMKAISARNDEPELASRPFDKDRDGFVMGEGAGVLVLETLDHALERGAKIYAEICGYGNTCDAYHISAPDPEGSGAARAMEDVLEDAGVSAEEVDYINAHGTSTVMNDELETTAIHKVFKEHAYNMPVSSTKSMTGHLLGAAGAIEGIACAMAIDRGKVPPTVNLIENDPQCDLDYVPNTCRELSVNVALSNAFGFGGHNVSLLFKKFDS